MLPEKFNLNISPVKSIENIALSAIDAASHVTLEGLNHTQRVLDHVELMGRRLSLLKSKIDQFQNESRILLKQQLIDLSRDSAEVSTEAIHQLSQVAKVALEELKEVGQSGGDLVKDLIEPVDIPNPFRQNHRKTTKQATVIPISIQDN